VAKYRCTVCNYIYDEDKEGNSFKDLPSDWACPVCGAPKSAFVPEGVVREESSEVKTTVADKIIQQLEEFGVRFVFGIPGDSNLPLIDSIRRSNKVRFILTRHEETAAFMASAYGKMTDTIGVCISIAGPGATNLITGLMDASADRAPVLALAGQVPEVYLGSEAFQEIDQLELFHPFTDFSETVARANQAVTLTTKAVKHSYHKPGVAVLSTPTDVLIEKLDEKILSPEKRLFTHHTEPPAEELAKAVELIDACGRVVILAGWGSRHAGEVLLELSDKLSAPIATTSRGKGIIDESLPCSLGVMGSIGSKHAALTAQGAELVMVVGSGFRHAQLIPRGVKMIQIDTDSTRIGRTFNIDVGLVGDAKLTLEKLAGDVKEKGRDEGFWAEIEKHKAHHAAELEAEEKDLSTPVNPGYVIAMLRRYVKKDAIICVDVGDHTYWFFKKFRCTGQRIFLSANIASMGFGLPAAMAAKLAYPEKQVICVTGDGGFGMLAVDFTTAVREKLGIKVLVFNDSKLKNIKKELERDGYPEFGVTFPNPDFASFARSAGGKGYRVDDAKNLDKVMPEAFAADEPVIIDIIVDPTKMAASGKRLD